MARQSRRRLLQGSVALVGLGLLAECGMLPPVPWRPTRIHRIGYLSGNFPLPIDELFRQGLHELGYVEGENLVIEWRYAEGHSERLTGLVAELLQLPVDALITVATPATLAAKQATTTTPVVFVSVNDPVGQGVVESLARPGANVTGLSTLSGVVSGKTLELLKEAAPHVSRVGVFWHAGNPGQAIVFRETQDAAQRLGLQLVSLPIHGPDDLDPAFQAAVAERVNALVLLPATSALARYRDEFVDFAALYRLPAVHPERERAQAGGLLSIEPGYAASRWRAAAYVDKILRGARPADLPVEQPTSFEVAVNLKTAQVLGLTIPQSVLQQATEIIQ